MSTLLLKHAGDDIDSNGEDDCTEEVCQQGVTEDRASDCALLDVRPALFGGYAFGDTFG
jgi:hypothetical protein